MANKKKKWGHSDFMQIGHKEFIGYDIKNKRFFTIFYDNKYREDVLYQDVMLKRLILKNLITKHIYMRNHAIKMKLGYWKGKVKANPKLKELADREIKKLELELKDL